MNWRVFEDKVFSCDWHVDAIDETNEGAKYVTIFSGPNAEERAREYGEWQVRRRSSPRLQNAESD